MSEAIRKLAEAAMEDIRQSGIGRTVIWSEMTYIIEKHMEAALAAAEPVASVDEAIRNVLARTVYESRSGRGKRGFMDHHIEAIVSALTPAIAQLVQTEREDAKQTISMLEREEDMAVAEATSDALRAVFERLSNHWLSAIDCNQVTHTDTPICSCGRWRGTERQNVGGAVKQWAEHAIGDLASASIRLKAEKRELEVRNRTLDELNDYWDRDGVESGDAWNWLIDKRADAKLSISKIAAAIEAEGKR